MSSRSKKIKFSQKTRHELGHYVYALVDPTDKQIFYVGKANANNRAFDHLHASPTECKKSQYVEEIRDLGLEPEVDILRYGISSEEACLEVEAAIIDAIGLENLTNLQRGHGINRGRLSSTAIEQKYASEPIDIDELDEPYVLFFIHNSYSPTQSKQEVYDATRQFWFNIAAARKLDPATEKFIYPTALAIVNSVVVEVYSIEAWFPAGSTLSSRDYFADGTSQRWEFVGQVQENHKLKGKRLQKDGQNIAANQNGFRYIN